MDTSKHTEALDMMKAEHRLAVDKVRADEDLTEDAKRRRIAELEREYAPASEEESARILEALDSKIESQYRKAHSPSKPSSDGNAELAREMRLARLREEVTDEFADSNQDPIRAYEEAVRLGDKERMHVIEKVGPKFLQDSSRKQRLAQLVDEQLPAGRREAKREHERLAAQRRNLEIGFALQRRTPSGRL